MWIRSNLVDQISFVLHLDEPVHITQAFIIVSLNETTATIHNIIITFIQYMKQVKKL